MDRHPASRRPFLAVSVVLACLAAALPVPPADAQEAERERVAITVYNQGSALVQDVRRFELERGRLALDFADVAATIDPTSVVLTAVDDPRAVEVLEQSYLFDLVGTEALLERYLEQTLQVTTEDGTVFTGALLSHQGRDLILREASGRIFVVAADQIRDLRFPELPDGLITRPTLRWLLESDTAGATAIELTYLAGGMGWTADYNVLLDDDRLDLNGWVTLTNSSGTTYRDALVKLVAGDVARIEDGRMERRMAADTAVLEQAAPPAVAQRELFEYQLYEIGRPVTVADNETKQVEFVTGSRVPARTVYVYDGFPHFGGYYRPIVDRGFGPDGPTDVQTWLEFTTAAQGGLGADLPAGRVRVYARDEDGAAILVGENRIDHTPEGEEVEIFLGNAFDLKGERVRTDYRQPAKNVIQESFRIELTNRKDEDPVIVRVPETLYRWSNWEIVEASHGWTKTDSSHVEFRVEVGPGETQEVTYTVRYSWPTE